MWPASRRCCWSMRRICPRQMTTCCAPPSSSAATSAHCSASSRVRSAFPLRWLPLPRRRRLSVPAEVAAILKLRAVVRKPVHVAGHFTSHCKEFEEVPEVHDESVCANCSITIPGREPIPEVASVRCVTCAATYCMSYALSRLPADKQPTVDKPLLGRLPPVAAEPRVVRYTLPVCAPPPLPRRGRRGGR